MKQSQICLWFDTQALEAAEFYTSIFPDGKIHGQDTFATDMTEINGKKEGDLLTVEFTMNGMEFIALNGGPDFTFSEAVSLVINCDDQEEVNHYWNALLADGGAESQCGWLKDKYGFSWQVVPEQFNEMLKNGTPDQRKRMTDAMLKMQKLDLAQLEKAYRNE